MEDKNQELDLYHQPIEDDDEQRNLAENPRALLDDYNEESMEHIKAASAV